MLWNNWNSFSRIKNLPTLVVSRDKKIFRCVFLAKREGEKFPRACRRDENVGCGRELCDISSKITFFKPECMREDGANIHCALVQCLPPPNFGFEYQNGIDGLAFYGMDRSQLDGYSIVIEDRPRKLARLSCSVRPFLNKFQETSGGGC